MAKATIKTTDTISADVKPTDAKPTDAKSTGAKARADKIAAANKLTFILETPVRKSVMASAREADMNINHYLQMIVENHIITNAPADDALAARLSAKRDVLSRAVEIAKQVDADGKFDENFILTVLQTAGADAVFKTAYETATQVNPENQRANNRAATALNQQLGRVIKRAAGARSLRKENGKVARAQVQGELISTYTLLQKAA